MYPDIFYTYDHYSIYLHTSHVPPNASMDMWITTPMIPRRASPLHLLSSPAPGESWQMQGAVGIGIGLEHDMFFFQGDFGEEVRCRGHRIQGIQDH